MSEVQILSCSYPCVNLQQSNFLWLGEETRSSDIYLNFSNFHPVATLDNELPPEASPERLEKEGRLAHPLRT